MDQIKIKKLNNWIKKVDLTKDMNSLFDVLNDDHKVIMELLDSDDYAID